MAFIRRSLDIAQDHLLQEELSAEDFGKLADSLFSALKQAPTDLDSNYANSKS